MLLTTATDIRARIADLLATAAPNSPIFVAVAFWGAGSESLFPDHGDFRLICNLHHPGTNPQIIRKIAARHQIKFLRNLHAKVLVGTRTALIGSANLSDAALEFTGSSSESWREAVLQVEKPSEQYFQARTWLASLWTEAHPVDEPSLASAEERWALENGRSRPTQESSPPPATVLSEGQIFSPNPIEGGDRVRMASASMNDLFDKNIASINKSNIRVPGFAANLLWTLAGNTIPTGISSCPVFSVPEQVIYRASDRESRQPKKNLEQLDQFLSLLAESSSVPQAVRHWANIWLQRQQTRGDASQPLSARGPATPTVGARMS